MAWSRSQREHKLGGLLRAPSRLDTNLSLPFSSKLDGVYLNLVNRWCILVGRLAIIDPGFESSFDLLVSSYVKCTHVGVHLDGHVVVLVAILSNM